MADAGARFYLGGGGERRVTKPELGPVEKGTLPGKARDARSWNEPGRCRPFSLPDLGLLGRSREARPSRLLRRIRPRC